MLISSCTSDSSPSYSYDPPGIVPEDTADSTTATSPSVVSDTEDRDNDTDSLLLDMESELVFSETDASPAVSVSADSAAALAEYVKAMSKEYRFSDLYYTEEAYKRMTEPFDKVDRHRFSALTEEGTLTAEHLFELVKRNNAEYLKGKDFAVRMSSAPKDKTIKEFCAVIVDTTNKMLQRYPDIDRDRVYCNLGNLKIVNFAGMLSFAEVTADLVMKVGEGNREMSTIATGGEDRYADIIAHETMHVIQVGCVCEKIENCNRRCGIFKRYDDFEANTANIAWMFEGGAERSVCNLTQRPPVTYTTMIGYICSLDLACMLRDEVSPDCMETIAFYEDPRRLFSLFDCESEEEYAEIVNMLISIHVIQANDEGIQNAYGERYSLDMTDDNNVNHFYRLLKPEICRTMSKVFYRNLAELLASGKQITANDLCYMINLFETSIGVHLRLSDSAVAETNADFIEEYRALRALLFDAVNTECGVDMASAYGSYRVLNATDCANASMSWNTAEKNKFMLDRTVYHGMNMEIRIG